ncbi:hypothetical protein ACN08Y_10815, partial [Rothia sp. P5764]
KKLVGEARDVIHDASPKLNRIAETELGKMPTYVAPHDIRFSQKTVNGSKEIIESMSKVGWKGDSVDVVRMPDGLLTTVDNTRVAAAQITNTPVSARIHEYTDNIDSTRIQSLSREARYKVPANWAASEIPPHTPQTWGDGVENRIIRQGGKFARDNRYGSPELPRLNS